MALDTFLFFAVLALTAGAPALLLATMPALRPRPLWMKVLVFAGSFVGLLPLAVIVTLLFLFQVLGIDLID